METSPHFLLLDSNSWVSDRLLLGALGSAVLHSMATNGTRLLLPEVVEKETINVLVKLTNQAADDMQKAAQLISQLTGHSQNIIIPNETAVRAELDARLANLGGVIDRVPFTFEHSKAALDRILAARPPCGPNNEQFRDCCVWQVAIDSSLAMPVHLVTNDKAFYQGGTHTGGLALSLREECEKTGRKVSLHPTLGAYLATVGGARADLDEKTIGAAILKAIHGEAYRIANEQEEVGTAYDIVEINIDITGYATPKESEVAVSFEAKYQLDRSVEKTLGTRSISLKMSLEGSCSFNPKTGGISDVEITAWTKSVPRGDNGWSSHSSPSPKFRKLYEEGNIRVLRT